MTSKLSLTPSSYKLCPQLPTVPKNHHRKMVPYKIAQKTLDQQVDGFPYNQVDTSSHHLPRRSEWSSCCKACCGKSHIIKQPWSDLIPQVEIVQRGCQLETWLDHLKKLLEKRQQLRFGMFFCCNQKGGAFETAGN